MSQKNYIVDVHFDVAKSHHVFADSREDAERIIWNLVKDGRIKWTDPQNEATDDVTVECVGTVEYDGEGKYHHEYFS